MSESEFQHLAVEALCIIVGGSVLWGVLFMRMCDAAAAVLGRRARLQPPSVLRSVRVGGSLLKPGGDERVAGRPSGPSFAQATAGDPEAGSEVSGG